MIWWIGLVVGVALTVAGLVGHSRKTLGWGIAIGGVSAFVILLAIACYVGSISGYVW